MRAAMTRTSRSTSISDDVDHVLDSPSEIETGTLAIKLNDTKKGKELWQRPTRKFQLDGKLVNYEIPFARIMPPENENINIKRYVVYDLSVRHNTFNERKGIDKNPITIERRYTDFLKLYISLKKLHPQLMNNIYFPKKVLMGNFSCDLIAERSSAFESMLDHVNASSVLRESKYFLNFLEEIEVMKGCQYLDERRNEMAVPIFENSFRLLNKIFMDRSKPVLLILCRLVAACTTSPVPHENADKWAELALRRYEGVCDTDLLILYIPLLHACSHLWWQKGRDKTLITERLNDMSKKGINVTCGPTLIQAIHSLDPRTETM